MVVGLVLGDTCLIKRLTRKYDRVGYRATGTDSDGKPYKVYINITSDSIDQIISKAAGSYDELPDLSFPVVCVGVVDAADGVYKAELVAPPDPYMLGEGMVIPDAKVMQANNVYTRFRSDALRHRHIIVETRFSAETESGGTEDPFLGDGTYQLFVKHYSISRSVSTIEGRFMDYKLGAASSLISSSLAKRNREALAYAFNSNEVWWKNINDEKDAPAKAATGAR